MQVKGATGREGWGSPVGLVEAGTRNVNVDRRRCVFLSGPTRRTFQELHRVDASVVYLPFVAVGRASCVYDVVWVAAVESVGEVETTTDGEVVSRDDAPVVGERTRPRGWSDREWYRDGSMPNA